MGRREETILGLALGSLQAKSRLEEQLRRDVKAAAEAFDVVFVGFTFAAQASETMLGVPQAPARSSKERNALVKRKSTAPKYLKVSRNGRGLKKKGVREGRPEINRLIKGYLRKRVRSPAGPARRASA
jgi:hypothetical protein